MSELENIYKKKMFIVANEEKCGGCNWKVTNLYLMGSSMEDAMKTYHVNEKGLCGDCMSGLIVDGQYAIIHEKDKKGSEEDGDKN